MIVSFLVCLFVASVVPSGWCHIGAANVSVGLTTALYTFLHFSKVAPHVDPARHLTARLWLAALTLSWARCGPHLSFESTYSPSTLRLAPGSMIAFPEIYRHLHIELLWRSRHMNQLVLLRGE